ncbi:MAG: hypothetical protein NXI31_03330 [bacterium]|nr:hypothetical protein [bacterium]
MLPRANRWSRSAASCVLCILAVADSGLAQGASYEPLPTGPSPASQFVWDSYRQVVVAVERWPVPRTWTWDGTRWSVVQGTSTPAVPVRLMFDSLQQLVLGVTSDVIFRWDGADWTAISAVGGLEGVAYDASRARMVTTDGEIVREWDGVAWVTVATTGGPGQRSGAAFAYDPDGQRCLLYGGLGSVGGADLWSWDGATWTQLAVNAPPGGRDGAGLVHDPSGARMVLYGGDSSGSTWALVGNAWTQIVTPFDPGPRIGATMAWDGSGLLLHGGSAARGGELWRFANGNWAELAGGVPVRRQDAAFGWDMARGQAVLLGGLNQSPFPGVIFDDTWTWDGVWQRRSTTTRPPTIGGYPGTQLVWSSAESWLLFWNGSTWSWTGTDWLQRSPAASPPFRLYPAMATDPAGGVMLFGGRTAQPSFFGDQWRWDGVDWQQLSPTGLPSARAQALAALDPVRNVVVMAGGQYFNLGLPETWEWDGVSWLQRSPAPFSFASRSPSAAYRPETGAVLFANYEHHEWDGVQWRTFAQVPGHSRDARIVTANTGAVLGYGGQSSADGDLVTFAEQHAEVAHYGVPCAVGPGPQLTTRGRPSLGNAGLRIHCSTRIAVAPTFVALGLAPASQPLGSGCQGLVGNVIGVHFLLSSASAEATVGLSIPNSPAFRGVDIFSQAAVLDPVRSLLFGVTISSGLRVTVGY